MACQFYFLPFCIIRSQVLLSNKTNRYFYDLNVLWVTLNENFCEWNETVLSVCLEQTQSFSSEKFLLLLFRCWVTDWTANTSSISLTNSNPIHDPIKHWNTLRISHNCWLSVVHYEATKGTPCWKWQISRFQPASTIIATCSCAQPTRLLSYTPAAQHSQHSTASQD